MDENGRKRNLKAEATRWLIFFGVAIVLSVLLWLGLSLTGRKNPITSFGTLVSDSSVTVGIEGNAPKSLDIRTEQGCSATYTKRWCHAAKPTNCSRESPAPVRLPTTVSRTRSR